MRAPHSTVQSSSRSQVPGRDDCRQSASLRAFGSRTTRNLPSSVGHAASPRGSSEPAATDRRSFASSIAPSRRPGFDHPSADVGERDLVDAGRAAVTAHQLPRALQRAAAMDLAMARVKPSPGIGLARARRPGAERASSPPSAPRQARPALPELLDGDLDIRFLCSRNEREEFRRYCTRKSSGLRSRRCCSGRIAPGR